MAYDQDVAQYVVTTSINVLTTFINESHNSVTLPQIKFRVDTLQQFCSFCEVTGVEYNTMSLEIEKGPIGPNRGGGGSRMASDLRRMNLVLATLLGVIIGSTLQSNYDSLYKNIVPTSIQTKGQDMGAKTGLVAQLDKIPFRPTSHVDEKGRPIEKQQFLEPFVVPNFVGYSVATYRPGQVMMPVHEHRSLHEFFYVLEGTGYFQIDGVDYKVGKGWFLHMAPHEKHGIWVPEDSTDGDLKVAVCGVTVGD